MHIVEAINEAQALDGQGHLIYLLTPGLRYVMFEQEAQAGERDGALKIMQELKELMPPYQGQALSDQRLLMMFTGGLGDALIMATCLNALMNKYPDVTMDICCPRAVHEILPMMNPRFSVIQYPLPATEAKNYSYYLSLERLQVHGSQSEYGRHDSSTSNLELFSRCLSTPVVQEVDRMTLPPELIAKWDIGQTPHKRVGIGLTKSHYMRAYPPEQTLQLCEALIEREIAVVLFGKKSEVDCELPNSPPWLCNLLDRTPSVDCIAAVISQLDALICPDTLFMHLGGVLRVPTVAIFTSSPATVAGGYPTVHAHTAAVDCSPCGSADDQCPLGYKACVVPQHPDMNAKKIADHLFQILEAGQGLKTLMGG